MTNKPENPPYALLERELALRWRVTARTLQRWRRDGNGPGWMKINGRVIYLHDGIEAWEREMLSGPTGGYVE